MIFEYLPKTQTIPRMFRYLLPAICLVSAARGYSAGPPDSVCEDPKLTPAGHEVDFQVKRTQAEVDSLLSL